MRMSNIDKIQDDNEDDGAALNMLESLLEEETPALVGETCNSSSQSIGNKSTDDSLKQSTEKLLANIHSGDTDSSDDEDNRYFENQKYNEYGKQIKSLINSNDRKESNFDGRYLLKEKNTSWKTKVKSSASVKPTKIQEKLDVYTDPVFGIRIINPLITMKQLQERMVGRTAIAVASIKRHISSGGAESDWVVAGVVVHKSSILTSQKGSQYCIWKISDLKGELKTVSVLFFCNSYKNLWKTPLGTVVGILNPKPMDDSKDGVEASVSVDNAQKVMILGVSKDYGICRAKKKNGDPCSVFVNTKSCTYCIYHVQQQYKKFSQRSDLQSPSIGNGLSALRNKVLGKNEVFYGGQSFTAVPAKVNRKQALKDDLKLRKLSQTKLSSSFLLKKENANCIKNFKDREILSCLTSPQVKEKICSEDVLHKFANRLNVTPQLSKSPQIDLSTPLNKIMVNRAKVSAVAWVKKNGKFDKSDPNAIQKKDTAKRKALDISPEDRARKVIKMATAKVTEESSNNTSSTKNVLPSRFMELLAAKSRHTNLVEARDAKAQEEYFDLLEKKEKIEEKMLTTFKVPCKAVKCLKCKYTAFSSSDLCKKEHHPLKVIEAVKRFFKCKNCNNRTATLELIPLLSCKQCGDSQWERAPMLKERRGNNIEVQPLSIRGGEEKHLGSVVGDGSLNLLVPE